VWRANRGRASGPVTQFFELGTLPLAIIRHTDYRNAQHTSAQHAPTEHAAAEYPPADHANTSEPLRRTR